MDNEVTAAKNVILRKIQYFKQRKLHLPNFIRKKREEILENRQAAPDLNNNRHDTLKKGKADANDKGGSESQTTAADGSFAVASKMNKDRLGAGLDESRATLNQASEREDSIRTQPLSNATK